MNRRAAWIKSLWLFDIWWRLNWRDVDARNFEKPYTRAWSA